MRRMKLAYLFIVVLLAAPLVLHADSGDEDVPIGDSTERWERARAMLLPACDAYLDAFSTPKDRQKWNRRLTERVQQRVMDGAPQNADSILQSIALDWVAGSEDKLRKRDSKAILTACLYFRRFIDDGIPPPAMMRQRLSMKDIREMVSTLDELVAGRGGVQR